MLFHALGLGKHYATNTTPKSPFVAEILKIEKNATLFFTLSYANKRGIQNQRPQMVPFNMLRVSHSIIYNEKKNIFFLFFGKNALTRLFFPIITHPIITRFCFAH